jgi:hypothetical protein
MNLATILPHSYIKRQNIGLWLQGLGKWQHRVTPACRPLLWFVRWATGKPWISRLTGYIDPVSDYEKPARKVCLNAL